MASGPRTCGGPLFLLAGFVLQAFQTVQSRGEGGVHFRIHTADLLNQHTHTRTVFLPPVRMYPPTSYMEQTVFIPRGAGPHPIRMMPVHTGFRPVQGPGPSRALMTSVHLPALPVHLSAPFHLRHSPMHVPPTKVFAHMPVHHMPVHHMPVHHIPVQVTANMIGALTGESPPASLTASRSPPLVSLIAVGRPPTKMSAALQANPSHEDLKKNKGCRAFVKAGHGEELGDGDCFLEEYEKGYNEEKSKKTFFGDENSDVSTEKEGERQSRRYKNQHQYVHHPKVKHEWVETADGRHLLLRTGISSQPQRMMSVARPAQVTLIRLPPGTAKLLVRPAKAEQDGSEDGWDEGEEPSNAMREDPDGNPVEQNNAAELVEVFKQSARNAPQSPNMMRPVWMDRYQPIRFMKEEDEEDDSLKMKETPENPTEFGKITAIVAETRMSRPLNGEMEEEDGWTPGFNAEEFRDDPQNDDFSMDFEVEDGDRTEKQEASTNIQDSFATVRGRGRAEEMLHRNRAGPHTTNHEQDSPRLSTILATGGHVFAPPTPPAPHAAAFGIKDPDRLEVGRKAPIVVEFGHELSGFKVTREKEHKKWR